MQYLGSDQRAAIRRTLEGLLTSSEFAHAPRHSRFLSFIVEETLAGRSGELKEYTIGIEVFEKAASFDSRTDSTVRTEASKLRARLDAYNARQGSGQPIQIRLPRGRYVPEFVEAVVVAARPEDAPGAMPVVPKPRPSRQSAVFAGLAVALAALAILYSYVRRDPLTALTRLYVLTSLPGSKRLPAWSPDGKSVVFCWERAAGNYDLYVMDADGRTPPRQLTSDPAQDWAPAWSPDGQVIAFVRDPYDTARVILIPAAGGAERTLEGVSSIRLAWTPDNRALLTQDNLPNDGPQAIFRVEIASGERKQLTFPATDEEPAGHTNFALSPTADRISFVSNQKGGTTLQVTPFDRWSPSDLAAIGPEFAGAAWAPDGKGLFVFAHRPGYLPLGGKQIWPIAGLDIGGSHPAATRASPARIVFVNAPQSSEFRQLEDGQERLLVKTGADQTSPRLSRDGKRLAFVSDRSGSRQIWLAPGDGGATRQLTSIRSCSPVSVDWSPDTKSLVFDCEEGPNSWLYLAGAEGGEPARVPGGGRNPHRPAFSADGKWIYFVAADAAKNQIWKLPADGHGSALLVADGPVYELKESSDGKYLYFTRERKLSGLWRRDLAEGSETSVAEDAISGWWDVTQEGVYWGVEHDGVLTFLRLAASGGKSVSAGTAAGARLPARGGLTIGPGGRIVFLKSTRANEDLLVAEFDHD